MNKEELLEVLRTGVAKEDKEGMTIADRIEDMNETELREAVIEFVYSRA